MSPAVSATAEPIKQCHIVAVPYPGRGHINPMMNICKLLLTQHHNLLITFVITEEWLGLIGLEDKPADIRFATIPNVLPNEKDRGADMAGFLEATQTKMAEPFEKLLDRIDDVKVIVADTFLNWAVEVGNQRNIPVASLWPMPVSAFTIFYHFQLLVQNGHYPFQSSERGEERVDYIPGIASIRLLDIPIVADLKDERVLNLVLQIFDNVPKAQYLLSTSISELEPDIMNALKQAVPIPIYPLGPVIPYSNLGTGHNQDYFDWLDTQPPCSVLYISLGSFLSVSTAQMQEIAHGLRDSGVRFLWVARGDAQSLQMESGHGKGLVVPWCEQLEVLCHTPIGGFWTHCGWNSTMEGIFAGLPMITLPILADQTSTSKFIVEDWRIGVRAGKSMGREEISKLVSRFMNLESAERKEMVKRAKTLQGITRRATLEGGSSRRNITAFLNAITSLC